MSRSRVHARRHCRVFAQDEVIDAGRTLAVREVVFREAFGPWRVHLDKIQTE